MVNLPPEICEAAEAEFRNSKEILQTPYCSELQGNVCRQMHELLVEGLEIEGVLEVS